MKPTVSLPDLGPSSATGSVRHATIYRMVTPDHLCPYGLKALDLLQRHGFAVDDRPLRSRADTDAFKAVHGVDTTPQIYLDGQRVGGYDALRRHLGLTQSAPDAVAYQPVLAVFGMTFAMALAVTWVTDRALLEPRTLEWFIALSMCVLAVLKLRDLEGFTTMFLGYDLLARRWVRYVYLYPFGEGLAGVLMIAGALTWLAAPIAFVIGTIGAVSVIKAVYVDRRSLRCACVGGDSRVPLGFVSLTENLMMVAMAIWMTVR